MRSGRRRHILGSILAIAVGLLIVCGIRVAWLQSKVARVDLSTIFAQIDDENVSEVVFDDRSIRIGLRTPWRSPQTGRSYSSLIADLPPGSSSDFEFIKRIAGHTGVSIQGFRRPWYRFW